MHARREARGMTLAELFALIAPPLCFGCGAGSRSGPLCSRCRTELRWLAPEPVDVAGVRVWAPVAYAGPARPLVGALKYRGAVALADSMAAQMVANPPPGLWAAAALVPVPMHPRRERRRGFNQAALLAAALARRTELGVIPSLRRIDGAPAQVGRGRVARLAALAGAFEVLPEAPVPERVLIVDDVVTTGATVTACAAALLGAGCREVVGVAYARTPGR
jgi:ComF family protein